MQSNNAQRAILFVALSTAMQSVAGVPEGFNVQLIPDGEFAPFDKNSKQGGPWLLDEIAAKAVIDEFNARKNDVVIDYEHQTLATATNGQPAPASGWIKALTYVKGLGLWARVEWTDQAKEWVETKAYKYLSPVFRADKATGRVTSLLNAGITNLPALDGMSPVALSALFAPCSDSTLPNHSTTPGAHMDFLVMLRQALGLKATDTEETVLTAVTALKATHDAQSAEVVTLKANAFDESKHVTLADHKKVNDELVALRNKAVETEVVALVEDGIKNRKLSPAQKEWAVKLGQTDVVQLKAFLASAGEVAPGESQTGGKGGDGGEKLDENDAEAVALKARIYIAEQEKLGRSVTAVEAVNHVSPKK